MESMQLANRLEELHSEHREEWQIEKERFSHEVGADHATHVIYRSEEPGQEPKTDVAPFVTPELGELLCLLHNNLDRIIASLRKS